ncbi:MAG: elongation factor Ts [Verrucomicrobiales bacterium]|jgi:elongation factor Ts
MAQITAKMVKELRDKTNAGMMDCKSALAETDGDMEEAATVLRKKGIASADKKSARAAKEGVIASSIDSESKSGTLIEVNCETDFVAKNENFQSFVDRLLSHIAQSDKVDTVEALMAQDIAGEEGTVETYVKSKIAEMGENMVVPRFANYSVDGEGVVASYIHMQGKVGVLIEAGCASAGVAQNESFRSLVKDITLHIAASSPVCITRDEVPSDLVEKEKEIFREQMKDKPANVIDKILVGKVDKYYSGVCLLEQAFVKDPDKSIGDLLKAKAAELGEEITIRRFTRFAVGETAE